MLTNIEEAIVEHLQQRLAAAVRIAIDEAHSALSLKLPGVDVIIGNGTFARVAQQHKLTCQVFVVVTFQNLRSTQDRRKGVYPIITSIVALLSDHKFGLAIDNLKPKRLDNITEEKEALEGKVIFQIEFETGFIIAAQPDETLTDLLSVGLNYYLQDPADDDEADASDLVTLSE